MKVASVADVKTSFSKYLKDSEEGPVVVTKNGKPVAVLLSVEDEDDLERLIMAYSPGFQEVLSNAKKQIHDTGGIQHDDFWEDMK